MDPIILLEQVHTFYNEAFSNLVTYTLALVGLIGIIIPAAVSWLQYRTLKAEKKSLQDELESYVEARQLKLSEELIQKFQKRFDKQKKLIDEKLSQVNAATFHIQGLMHDNQDLPVVAMDSYSNAAMGYILARDEMNSTRCLRLVIECLSKIDKEELRDFDVQPIVEQLINFLKDHNINDRYTDIVASIEKELKISGTRESTN